MRILFACGGTAGHINPAISVANAIRNRHHNSEILFAGTPSGMEARLVKEAGFEFIPFKAKGFQRKISLLSIKNNIYSLFLLLTAFSRAKKILLEFKPDVVIGTGGYVSGPIVYSAAKLGIKTAIHEQNAYPGLTTRILSSRVNKILLAVEEASRYLKHNDKCIVVGNPVREEILFADKQKSRRKLKLDDRPVVLSFGGSLGASKINETIADLIAWHIKIGDIQHIHATGQNGAVTMSKELERKNVNLSKAPQIRVLEYISNMDDCLAAADLVICRAGAITLSELQVQGKPAILIPSPNVTENHQYHNAMAMASRGAAIVIQEKDLNGRVLRNQIRKLIQNPILLKEIGEKALSMAVIDSNILIYNEIIELLYS